MIGGSNMKSRSEDFVSKMVGLGLAERNESGVAAPSTAVTDVVPKDEDDYGIISESVKRHHRVLRNKGFKHQGGGRYKHRNSGRSIYVNEDGTWYTDDGSKGEGVESLSTDLNECDGKMPSLGTNTNIPAKTNESEDGAGVSHSGKEVADKNYKEVLDVVSKNGLTAVAGKSEDGSQVFTTKDGTTEVKVHEDGTAEVVKPVDDRDGGKLVTKSAAILDNKLQEIIK